MAVSTVPGRGCLQQDHCWDQHQVLRHVVKAQSGPCRFIYQAQRITLAQATNETQNTFKVQVEDHQCSQELQISRFDHKLMQQDPNQPRCRLPAACFASLEAIMPSSSSESSSESSPLL